MFCGFVAGWLICFDGLFVGLLLVVCVCLIFPLDLCLFIDFALSDWYMFSLDYVITMLGFVL